MDRIFQLNSKYSHPYENKNNSNYPKIKLMMLTLLQNEFLLHPAKCSYGYGQSVGLFFR
jgi:hypothetical protein